MSGNQSEADLYDFLLKHGYERFEDLFKAKSGSGQHPNVSYANVKYILPSDEVEPFWEIYRRFFSEDTAPHQSGQLNSTKESPSLSNNPESLADKPNQPDKEERVNRLFVTENLNISEILNSTFEGKLILDSYSSKKRLDPTKRKKIVHLILCSVLRQCDRKLEEQDFLILRRKVVEVFPSERSSIWYSPSVSRKEALNNRSQKASGKFLHKYNNLRRLPIGVYKPHLNTVDESDEDNLTEDIEESINWIRTKEEPWNSAKFHWKRTYEYRHRNEDKEPNKLIGSIFDDWPILKSAIAYELILLDFDLSGVCKVEKPTNNFHSFYKKISERRTLPKDDICQTLLGLLEENVEDKDPKLFMELMLISYMIAPDTRIRQGDKKFWKPSCIESFEGIITHVKSSGDIKKVQEEKRLFARSKNITLQPYILVVGEEDFLVDSSYLLIDEHEYKLPSLSEAIDCCFKSFHVFWAKYPPQSEHLWLLLQQGIYQFRTRWDPCILKVDGLLHDIGLFLPLLNLNTD